MTHGVGTANSRQKKDEKRTPEVSSMVTPPDGGWGWIIVFGSFAIHVVIDGMTYSFGILYDIFLDYFKEGKGYTSLIASILVGVTLCSGPISSALVNKYGCRMVTIIGSIVGGLSLIISVFAQNVLTLIITIGFGAGMGFGLIYLPAIVCVTVYFERLRSLATGIAVCGSGFGTFIFAPLTVSLINNYGWRGAMLIIAGIVFNCTIFGAMFRPLEPVKVKKKKENGFLEVPAEDSMSLPERTLSEKVSKRMNKSLLEAPIHENGLGPIQRSHSMGHGLIKPKDEEYNNNKNGKMGISDETARLAVSQPLLNEMYVDNPVVPRRTGSGIHWPDVLFHGSLHNLPHFRSRGELSRTSAGGEADRYGSIRRVDQKTMDQSAAGGDHGATSFKDMLNWELMKDWIFIIFIVSNILTSIGFNIPYVYITVQAKSFGMNSEDAGYLLSIIGAANTIGRIILGYLTDKPWVNRLLVYNMCLTICGIASALSIFCTSFYSMACYAFIYGFFIGAYVGLTSVILVDLLGLDKLTSAFGLLLLFQGIASFAGPPLAGFLYDMTESYNPGFLLCGGTIGLSGVILFLIPPTQRYLVARQVRRLETEGQMMATI